MLAPKFPTSNGPMSPQGGIGLFIRLTLWQNIRRSQQSNDLEILIGVFIDVKMDCSAQTPPIV
jgi:hypothetical protein